MGTKQTLTCLTLVLACLSIGKGNTPLRLFTDDRHRDSLLMQTIKGIDSATVPINLLSPQEKALYFKQKAQAYEQGRYYSTAISLYNQAIESVAGFPEADSLQINLIEEQNYLYEAYGDYSTGMEQLYKLLKVSNGKFPLNEAKAYIRLGFYHALLGNTSTAQTQLEQASALINRLLEGSRNTSHLTASMKEEIDDARYQLHNTWAQILSGIQIDSAFRHLELAEQYSGQKVQKIQVIYQNKAVLYSYMHDYPAAEAYFQKALALIEDSYQRVAVLSNIAELESMKGDLGKSRRTHLEALKQARAIDAISLQSRILESLSGLCAKQGMFKQAYDLQQQAQALADSTFISENQTKILDMQRDFELFKAENDKRLYQYQTEVSQLEIARKNTSIIFVSLCLLAACGLAASLYSKFRKQRSKSHELNRLMEQTASQDRTLMQSLKDETEKKARELVSATLSMAKINEVLSETLTGIEQVRRTTRDAKSGSALLQIESRLRALDYDERQWGNFKLYFEQIHPMFFSRLSRTFPALTAGELRICAFIVMNMTSKEIASITNRSVRTIDSIKFRLRSKLDIPKETSTLAFLLAFTNHEDDVSISKLI